MKKISKTLADRRNLALKVMAEGWEIVRTYRGIKSFWVLVHPPTGATMPIRRDVVYSIVDEFLADMREVYSINTKGYTAIKDYAP